MVAKLQAKWLVIVLSVGLVVFFRASMMTASDAKAEAKTADADASKEKDASGEAKDPYAVPDGTPEELLKFIEQTGMAFPSKAKSQEELITMLKKSRSATVKAADKMLAAHVEGSLRLKAIEAKLRALAQLGNFGDADAKEQSKAFVDELKNDKQLDVKQLATFYSFANRMGEALSKPAAAKKLWNDLKDELQANATPRLVGLASSFATRNERQDPEAAAKSLLELKDLLSQNKDPEIQGLVKRFDGIARRLTLMGKPMEIQGTLLDGTPFDRGSLNGKVVLVDFWATWCGPCRAELPNVKKNYEKYHAKGFEVVGVSLDRDIKDLKRFIEDQNITWPILFPTEKKDQFWNHPLAVYYGVNGIPCVILMNQKGEVVSLNARGPELGKKLEELLGKVDDKDDKASDKESGDSKPPKG